MENTDNKIIKLINNDIIIGNATNGDKEGSVIVEKPYTVKDLGKGPCVMPYEFDILLEPMTHIGFQAFNILWIKNLSDFPQVESQYIQATTGLEF